MTQSRENLRRDGRTDGRTEGRTLFYRTLPAEAGGRKNPRSQSQLQAHGGCLLQRTFRRCKYTKSFVYLQNHKTFVETK